MRVWIYSSWLTSFCVQNIYLKKSGIDVPTPPHLEQDEECLGPVLSHDEPVADTFSGPLAWELATSLL